MADVSVKRVLVVSNECFSFATSNGRTLANLLKSFGKKDLAQFYIHGIPEPSVCSQYYTVSDQDALAAFLCKKQKRLTIHKIVFPEEFSSAPKTEARQTAAEQGKDEKRQAPAASHGAKVPAEKKIRRSCKNILLRDVVWCSYRWWKRDFSEFLQEFAPEVVLLQAGDSPFMYAIARKIARKYHAHLVMFNTESYALKQVLYAGVNEKNIWHRLLRHRLRVQYRRFMKQADFCIYNTQWLEEAYQKAYPHPGKSRTFYVSTDLTPAHAARNEDEFDVTYCGNLGVGRVAPLYELANVLHEALPEAKLHIYGKFYSTREQTAFLKLPNVICHGLVPYSQIPDILASSALVLHCENPKRVEDLKYAFSTKIADCLVCGRPFLVYASREYPFVQYLERFRCAHIASTPQELHQLLLQCKDRRFCDSTLENAKRLAEQNHNAQKNSEGMRRALCDIH